MERVLDDKTKIHFKNLDSNYLDFSFWVPIYFPFCQIASRTGPFEFFRFTTSARKNRSRLLDGASSVLHTMRGPEMAAAFGISMEEYDRSIGAQNEAVILPSTYASPPEKVPKVLRRFEYCLFCFRFIFRTV